jgi:U3 small nucleolar ribonucleoprotein component
MIKQRILDEAWDDPIQYSQPKPIRETFSSLDEINFEKSSKGLAEIMEDKYKKDVMKIQTATPQDELQKECDMLFKKLCYNLDVLSNLNFVPKPSFEQPKIVANVASIQLEEKTPLGFSMAKQKAPQEVFDPSQAQFKVNKKKSF